jgi:hypothetical protein
MSGHGSPEEILREYNAPFSWLSAPNNAWNAPYTIYQSTRWGIYRHLPRLRLFVLLIIVLACGLEWISAAFAHENYTKSVCFAFTNSTFLSSHYYSNQFHRTKGDVASGLCCCSCWRYYSFWPFLHLQGADSLRARAWKELFAHANSQKGIPLGWVRLHSVWSPLQTRLARFTCARWKEWWVSPLNVLCRDSWNKIYKLLQFKTLPTLSNYDKHG